MDPKVGTPVPNDIRDVHRSHLWILGLIEREDGSVVGIGPSDDSFGAECSCPEFCLRDHGNE